MELDTVLKKIVAVVIAEVMYAFIFVVAIIWVEALNEATNLIILTPTMLVSMWALLGIGTPIAIFTPILEYLPHKFGG